MSQIFKDAFEFFLIVFLFSHPIDVVKTRLQISGDGSGVVRNYKALGIGGTVSIIASEEGIPAFWKGIASL